MPYCSETVRNLCAFLKMDIKVLLKNELEYELRVRGLRHEGTVAELRQRLHRAFADNVQPREDIIRTLNLVEELASCRSKFEVLQAFVAELEEEDFDAAEYRRADSRLWHLYYRIARLPVRPGEDDGAPLLNEVKELWDKLKQLCYGAAGMRGNVLSTNTRTGGNPATNQETAPAVNGSELPAPSSMVHASPARTNPFLWDDYEVRLPAVNAGGTPLATTASGQQQVWYGLYQNPHPPSSSAAANASGDLLEISGRDGSFLQGDNHHTPFVNNPVGPGFNIPVMATNGFAMPMAQPTYPFYAPPPPVLPANPYPVPQNLAGPVLQRQRDLKLYKWGFKFTGDEGGTNLSTFLEKVAGMMGSRGVSKWEILPSVGELLDGTAAIVYRANRHRLTTWEDFVRLLQVNFRDPDYDMRLFDEIRRRTQGADESVGVYMAKMRGLFNRLSYTLPEAQKVSLVERNVRPELLPFMARCNFFTLDQLESELTNIEVWTRRAARYQDPPPSRSSMEPDLAYVGKTGNQKAVPKIAAVKTTGEPEKAKRKVMTCWNCKQPNHPFFKCTAPLTVFCTRCGNDGVATSDCARCKKPENSERRDPPATGDLLQM